MEAASVRVPLVVSTVFEVSPWLAIVLVVCPRAWRSVAIDVFAVSPERVISLSVELSEEFVTLFKALFSVFVSRVDDGGNDELADNMGEIGNSASQWSDAACSSSFSIESSTVLVDFWWDEKIPVDTFANGLLDHIADLAVHTQIAIFVLDAVEFAVVVSLREIVVAVELVFEVLFAQNWPAIGQKVAGDERSVVGVKQFIAFALEVSATFLFCRGKGDTCC